MIYFDNSATTSILPPVVSAMIPYIKFEYGNPSSLYKKGIIADVAVNKARDFVKSVFNCNNVIFTSGGSEGDNLVLKGFAFSYYKKYNKPCTIATSSVEHAAIMNTMKWLSDFGIANWIKIPYLTGKDLIEYVTNVFDKFDVDLLSFMTVNNEIGTIFPIPSLSALCKKYDVKFHTDFVQAVEHKPFSSDKNIVFDCNKFDVDYLTISAHKFFGPKGVGAVCLSSLSDLTPIIHGGEQEFSLRGGTENVAGIVGLHKALECSLNYIPKFDVDSIRRYIWSSLFSIKGSHLNTDLSNSVDSILNVRFDGIDAQTLIALLSLEGVCVSAVSACHSKSPESSHVLKAIGLSDDESFSSIRISLSRYSNPKEAEHFVHIISKCINDMRSN